MFEGDLPEPQLGTVFKKIAGIVHYNYEEYKIMPRENNDMEIVNNELPKEEVIVEDVPVEENTPNTNTLGKSPEFLRLERCKRVHSI